MPGTGALESILVVYQNPLEGREVDYDDWYTNIHIRDAMRLDGAIATQRFVRTHIQPTRDGLPIDPGYYAHTIYEWEDAQASVAGHQARAGTERMQITADASFKALRDYFYRPVFLSHGWTREHGFRRGTHVLTALIARPMESDADFADWFANRHTPDTLALPGFASAGLFSLHEQQSLPIPTQYTHVAVYGLSDAAAAARAWSTRKQHSPAMTLESHAALVDAGCWQPRICRLRAEQVVHPDAILEGEEARARALYDGRYLKQAELQDLLNTI